MLNSWAKVAASRGVRLAPPPPTMIGVPASGPAWAGPDCRPAGSAPGEREGLAEGCRHKPVITASCSSSRSNRSPSARERDPVGPVLVGVPPGAESELHPPPLICRPGDGDGQRPRETEGGCGEQGPEPDAARFPGDGTQGDPRVGRPGETVSRPWPGSGRCGRSRRTRGPRRPGHGQQVLVGRPLLGLGEDPKEHAACLVRTGLRRSDWRVRVRTPPGSLAAGPRSDLTATPSSSSASPAPARPPASDGPRWALEPRGGAQRICFNRRVRANITTAKGTPSRNIECSERTKDSRIPCCTAGG